MGLQLQHLEEFHEILALAPESVVGEAEQQQVAPLDEPLEVRHGVHEGVLPHAKSACGWVFQREVLPLRHMDLIPEHPRRRQEAGSGFRSKGGD